MPAHIQILVDPEDVIQGLLFKLPRQAKNANAPVYYIPEMNARTAFRMGHSSIKIPGESIEGRVLGICGRDVLQPNARETQNRRDGAGNRALSHESLQGEVHRSKSLEGFLPG